MKNMIFSELHSAYYTAVGRIISRAVDGGLDAKAIDSITRECAFSESVLTVAPSLLGGDWRLLRKDLTTPITHEPRLPLTLIEKRWLKAILSDPRIRLFDPKIDGLEDVEPLFCQEDIILYDKYSDGDPYTDPAYIAHFRTCLEAIRAGHALHIEMYNASGKHRKLNVRPLRLEYSEKDDKFRIVCAGTRQGLTVNLGRVRRLCLYVGDKLERDKELSREKRTLVLSVTDTRNGLERVLLHFAHFEKRVERASGREYILYLNYDPEDEEELVIRVLSFGTVVKALSPQSFVEKIKERLICQPVL